MPFNSTIKQKIGLCIDCDDGIEKPVIAGRCKAFHYKRHTQRKSRLTKKARPPLKPRKIKKSSAEQSAWYVERGEEMTGRCIFCGEQTCAGTKLYKRSVCHLFPKRPEMFPSIATHPENSIEACFFGRSHHSNFDNNILTFEIIKVAYPHAWAEIVRKTKILYPVMTPQEQKKVPKILVDEI